MYLSEIYAENYRIFGTESDGLALRLPLARGLNVLVGENDGGKTAVIDALRHCLSTTSNDRNWVTEDDFHCGPTGRAREFLIRCKFDGLDASDAGTFMEWLTFPSATHPVLYIAMRARMFDTGSQTRVAVTVHSGEDGTGPTLEGVARELLRATYLKPLRDAEAELSSGRGSRLSQILAHHPGIASQAVDDFAPGDGTNAETGGTTLVGIVRRAEHHIKLNAAVVGARDEINTRYLSRLQVGTDRIESEVGVARDVGLQRILEKLELAFAGPEGVAARTRRGLGLNNSLFMATELLLLGARDEYPLLLVEEPEAHLHPQLQARVIDLLKSKAADDRTVQVILTTHSPYLASSVPLENLTLICGGKTYPLGEGQTKLNGSDRRFLERFLDSTKANLFFARAVAIVEGDAENILLPALGEKVSCSFSENGVSVVNVGHTGLFRYSKIFLREDGQHVPVRVACLRDMDVAPDDADEAMAGKLKKAASYGSAGLAARREHLSKDDEGPIRSFVSDHWTLEYDLATASWPMAKIMHKAIQSARLAKKTDAKGAWPTEKELEDCQADAAKEVEAWQQGGVALTKAGLDIYRPLRIDEASKAVAAQFAATMVSESDIKMADLPSYLQGALSYLCATQSETQVIDAQPNQ